MMAEGMERIWARHDRFARAIWIACARWGADGPLRMNVGEEAHRSRAVTSLRLEAPDATRLREWAAERAGLPLWLFEECDPVGIILGIGLGMAPPRDPAWYGFFRLGHMGHLNGQMIMALLGSVDAGLKALEIPHGSGALEAASVHLATA